MSLAQVAPTYGVGFLLSTASLHTTTTTTTTTTSSSAGDCETMAMRRSKRELQGPACRIRLRDRKLAFLLLLSLLLQGTALADSKTTKLEREIVQLKQALEQTPKDVDLRLKLAYRLSWLGKGKAAKSYAEEVIRQAPTYWDAHILRARMTSWEKHYKLARKQLQPVLSAEPSNQEALRLLATLSMWARDWDTAEATLNILNAKKPSAELYFQLAQIALERLDPVRARLEASKALSLDPDFEKARALRASIRVIKFYATSQTEYFPALQGANRRAYGQTLVASILPGAALSVTLSYEFARRFSTDNHRFGGRLNLSLTDDFILSAFLRGGNTEVVPPWSMDFGLTHKLSRDFAVGLRYNLDLMSWPGTLHRGTFEVSSQVSERILLGGQFFGGLMRHCGESSFVEGAALKSAMRLGPLVLGLRYSFGTELEGPALSPLLKGRFGSDFCFDDLGIAQSGSPLSLPETRAHDIGGSLSLRVRASTLLVAGYGLQLRFDNTEVHLFYASLQQSL